MKFKAILPYFIFGSLVLAPKAIGKSGVSGATKSATTEQTMPKLSAQDKIENKAQELCDTYIDNVLQGQKRIKNTKGGHKRAVLSEFPGAYTRWYCIYGQYTQLNRAVSELGDTLNLIPYDGRHACPAFRSEMQKKYSGKEYAGALHNGKMLKPDAYNRARDAYLKKNHVTAETSDSVRNAVIARFEKNNFSVESLHPGAILIIQKSATPSNTHAVMYLGRGRVENGVFVPDSNGKFMYAGYNNEAIDDIFKTFNTNRIFAADIYDIACVEYNKEFDKIQNMQYDDMFRYVYNMPSDLYAIAPNQSALRDMAAEKYFDKQHFIPKFQPVQENTASVIPNISASRRKLLKQKLGLVR